MNATPVNQRNPTEFTPAIVEWGDDGVPRSPVFGDVFHSIAGARSQCEHVFIDGNELPKLWLRQDDSAIGELGFGSGLNFLVTAEAWLKQASAEQRLYYCAIEKHPWSVADSRRLFKSAGINEAIGLEWLQLLPQLRVGSNRLVLGQGRIILTLHVGDVESVLPQMRGHVDAWYCDGFNPRGNANMWNTAVARELFRLCRPGATLATWCCAGEFRRALVSVGFELRKRAGFAHKREMLTALKPGSSIPRKRPRRVQIIGAGLAGSWLAREFANRGVAVELYERRHGPAREASGMPMLMVRPYSAHRDTPIARFFWQAAPFAVNQIQVLGLRTWIATPIWREFGDEPVEILEPAGWLDGAEVCSTLIDHPLITPFWNHEIPTADGWACRTDPTFFCTATASPLITGESTPIKAIRGQLSLWTRQEGQLGERHTRVGNCVAASAPEGLYFGASQVHNCDDPSIHAHEALEYGRNLPCPPMPNDLADMRHWAGVRRQTRDRLPLCGPAIDTQTPVESGLVAGRAAVSDIPANTKLWLNLAHGSRAATAAPICAALLADAALDLPAPCLGNQIDALDPRRFLLRDWRRGKRFPKQSDR